jgi:hypothetical protein
MSRMLASTITPNTERVQHEGATISTSPPKACRLRGREYVGGHHAASAGGSASAVTTSRESGPADRLPGPLAARGRPEGHQALAR